MAVSPDARASAPPSGAGKSTLGIRTPASSADTTSRQLGDGRLATGYLPRLGRTIVLPDEDGLDVSGMADGWFRGDFVAENACDHPAAFSSDSRRLAVW